MFDNIYLEKIAKIVGLKGDLLPNRAEVMDRALMRDMEEQIWPTNTRPSTGVPRSSGVGGIQYSGYFEPDHGPHQRHKGVAVGGSYTPEGAVDPREPLYQRRLKAEANKNPAPLLLEHKPAVAPAVVPTRTDKVVRKAAQGGMSLGKKLGIGGLAAAGLLGGGYAMYSANDGHHKKKASAIEGLVLAGYSVEQALQLLEG